MRIEQYGFEQYGLNSAYFLDYNLAFCYCTVVFLFSQLCTAAV